MIDTSGATGNRVTNDAGRLAQELPTEESPRFVNALLDKIWNRLKGQPFGPG